MIALQITALSLRLEDRLLAQIPALTVQHGEMWAVLGPNGAGKTTLLHTLAGLRPTSAGSIHINEQALQSYSARERARHVGMLLQDTDAQFPGTALELALSGRFPHSASQWFETRENVALALAALDEVDCRNIAQRDVQSLSGGERRRVAIAALFAQNAPLMILDEPGNHLDIKHHVDVLCAVRRRVQTNTAAAVLSMHDVNAALQFCDHALLMFGNGEVMAGTCQDVLTEENLSKLYGHTMVMLGGAGQRAFVPQAK